MAYSVSSATNINDVISQMCAFAVTNAGFTDQGTTTETSTGRTLRRISKGGVYWTFRVGDSGGAAAPNAIEARMSYSITANVAPTSANGQQGWTRTSLWTYGGPYSNLYLYTDSTNVAVHAVIECAAGIYSHMSFGSIIKTDTFTGGEYISGNYGESRPSGFSFVDIGSTANSSIFPGMFLGNTTTGYWTWLRSIPATGSTGDQFDFSAAGSISGSGSTLRYNSFGGLNGWAGTFLRDAPNVGTLRSPMFPFYVAQYDIPSARMAIAGYVPGARLISNEYVDDGEILLTNWQTFSYSQKNGSGLPCPSSLGYGIAYYRA